MQSSVGSAARRVLVWEEFLPRQAEASDLPSARETFLRALRFDRRGDLRHVRAQQGLRLHEPTGARSGVCHGGFIRHFALTSCLFPQKRRYRARSRLSAALLREGKNNSHV